MNIVCLDRIKLRNASFFFMHSLCFLIFSVYQVPVPLCDGRWFLLSAAALLLCSAGDGEEAR